MQLIYKESERLPIIVMQQRGTGGCDDRLRDKGSALARRGWAWWETFF